MTLHNEDDRARGLREAIDEIRKERRWQIENSLRAGDASPHVYADKRLEIVENILVARADALTPQQETDHTGCHYQQGYMQGVQDAPMIARVAADGEYTAPQQETDR